jgi:hypothetical protein
MKNEEEFVKLVGEQGMELLKRAWIRDKDSVSASLIEIFMTNFAHTQMALCQIFEQLGIWDTKKDLILVNMAEGTTYHLLDLFKGHISEKESERIKKAIKDSFGLSEVI